jgi:hypothetical protein
MSNMALLQCNRGCGDGLPFRSIRNQLQKHEHHKELPYQLADIYHFHLHPQNLPDAANASHMEHLMEEARGVGNGRTMEHKLRDFKFNASRACEVEHALTELKILYQVPSISSAPRLCY